MILLWGIIICILIISMIILHLTTSDNTQIKNTNKKESVIEENIIHSRCNGSCSGDLTCDLHSKRCKKQLGGDCAMDVDCQTGLYCNNWKCSNEKPFHNLSTEFKAKTDKKVHWE